MHGQKNIRLVTKRSRYSAVLSHSVFQVSVKQKKFIEIRNTGNARIKATLKRVNVNSVAVEKQ